LAYNWFAGVIWIAQMNPVGQSDTPTLVIDFINKLSILGGNPMGSDASDQLLGRTSNAT